MAKKNTIILLIQLIVPLCFLTFSLLLSHADITIDVRDGLGIPGSSDNSVEVSLENINDQIKGISVDICDVGNYLTCTGCEATDRTPGFWCLTNEFINGCARVILFSPSGALIEEGTGPVLTLSYEVSGGAPSSGCKALNPAEASVMGEDGEPLQAPVVLESGTFCFVGCVNDEDCDDGLFCNGVETCDVGSGDCQDGSYPCQTSPDYSCDEETDQCVPGPAPVFLTVEDGLGIPGSSDNSVEVSLENINDQIKGISVDICDVGNYLTCTGCEATNRTPGFWCYTNEFINGCARVILFSPSGALIEEGTGPVLTLSYEVSGGAPSAGCKALNPEEASVMGENGEPLQAPVILESGTFCFVGCVNDEDCDDGLFCNGVETCDVGSGDCQDGSYPCQTSPDYSCDEETDQCVPGPAPVFLTVEDGVNLPGSSDSPLDVSLENTVNKIKGVSMELCDAGNYLTCTGCEATDRTPGFSCYTNELENGCVKVIFFSHTGALIEEGAGSIFTLTYDVSAGAPSDECRDLNPEEVSVMGENGEPLQAPVILESGTFCFSYCVSDEDCADGLFCNGAEICVGGFCLPGTDPCPDDELFCNGTEGCDEDNDLCTHSGDPCPPLICDEVVDACSCSLDEDCYDGLFCNGVETCVDGYCQPGTNPCPETACNTCQEDSDSCYDPEGTFCNDGLFCNGDDTCDGLGNCVYSGDPCPPPLVCNEDEDVCNCTQDEDCNDSLFCSGEETCVDAICQPGDYPCSGEDCDDENDICKPVVITIGDGSGFQGTTNNPVDVSLENLSVKARGVQIDVCDVDDYLTCTGCEATERAPGFFCITYELDNGCCRVFNLDMSGFFIEEGTGPIFTLNYDLSEEVPAGECRNLNPENVMVLDEDSNAMNVIAEPGEFCFNNCSTNQDCDDGNICTDDVCDGSGVCVYSHNNYPCDDGVYCNGDDTCFDGSCSIHSGDPCPSGTSCNEGTDSCNSIPTATTTTTSNTTSTTTSIIQSTTTTIQSATGTYFISGYVKGDIIENLPIILTGTASKTCITNSDGYYEFSDLNSGFYTITQKMLGYSFEPPSYVVQSLTNSIHNMDFASTRIEPAPHCIVEEIFGEHSEETELLRYIRNNVLSRTPEGQEIIRVYYEWSPMIIEAMEEGVEFKEEVKKLIDGILPLIWRDVE